VHIFYCAGGKFGEVAGVFLAHRTLASRAPDAESERPVQTVPGPARVRHWTTGTGRGPVRPVVRVRCEVRFAELSEFKSGEHWTQRGASGGVSPVT